jgi:nucleotide-binding universal stress UspA family protein
MYKRILVPVDGSATAARGLNEAIKLAGEQGAALRLVHVVDELFITSPFAVSPPVGDLFEMLRQEGRSVLDKAETTVREAGVDVDAVLVDALGGQAGEYILQQAKQWQADLIVCGTHGRRGIRRIVMGSDAEYVVRHAQVPVLLVRNPDDR